MFAPAPPIAPRSFEDTPFSWVSTPAEFGAMLEQLRTAREIAVDLEYHSYRTFGGFVCLMQISTRDGDFVVDTLALRDEMEELNEVFTDPEIVKVFHGAESDIVWLQQDFNLYVVNLFDTYHASKVLGTSPSRSTALLLIPEWQTSLDTALRPYWRCTAISPPTNGTNSPTGGYGTHTCLLP